MYRKTYPLHKNDFVAQAELTKFITLSDYRNRGFKSYGVELTDSGFAVCLHERLLLLIPGKVKYTELEIARQQLCRFVCTRCGGN
jgi:peroxiredoxin